MQKIWSEREIRFLAENLSSNTKEIYLKFCDKYGSAIRTYNSIQKKVKKLRDAYSNEPDESLEAAAVTEELDQTLTDTLDELFTGEVDKIEEIEDSVMVNHVGEILTARQVAREHIELVIPDTKAQRKRDLRDEAKWWLEGIIEESRELVFPPFKTPTGTSKSLCVLISDSHIGKLNDHFNLEIAKHRINSLPEKIFEQEGHQSVDEIVLMFIGDLLEGEDIFKTQAHHIECPAITQIQVASTAFWQMILKFKQLFKCTVRIECVPGNHGRMSKTANEKTNWDNVLYHILRVVALGHEDKDIIINCNFDAFRLFQVKDKTGMLYHQGVKHTGTAAMREKVAGWSQRKHFDFMCHGHWHEWHVGNWLGRFVVANGCLCGPDDLAERMAKEDTARQGYFFITPGKPLGGFGVIEWLG